MSTFRSGTARHVSWRVTDSGVHPRIDTCLSDPWSFPPLSHVPYPLEQSQYVGESDWTK